MTSATELEIASIFSGLTSTSGTAFTTADNNVVKSDALVKSTFSPDSALLLTDLERASTTSPAFSAPTALKATLIKTDDVAFNAASLVAVTSPPSEADQKSLARTRTGSLVIPNARSDEVASSKVLVELTSVVKALIPIWSVDGSKIGLLSVTSAKSFPV